MTYYEIHTKLYNFILTINLGYDQSYNPMLQMCQLHYNERLLRLYCNMHMYKEDQFTRIWSIIRSKGFSGRDLLTTFAHPRTLAAGPLQVEKPELTL